ncbi:hypothetical protein BDV39DRAFT_62980 [Aspergillus sergii]|uniref:Uncharacterized protein n=1 Tax=Aspergillus sergii TaxID=1034303 RepID=A0A5N6X6I2_9EURO|nr:hypothetical protein BDV39DRAFT_62980 [Aspergillus sergii]
MLGSSFFYPSLASRRRVDPRAANQFRPNCSYLGVFPCLFLLYFGDSSSSIPCTRMLNISVRSVPFPLRLDFISFPHLLRLSLVLLARSCHVSAFHLFFSTGPFIIDVLSDSSTLLF